MILMILIQQRIPELETYVQLASGEVGFIDPATIWVAVDKSSWSDARKMSLADFLSNSHIETANIASGSTSLSGTYDSAFESGGYYFNLQVYKVVSIPGVGDVRESVPYHSLATTVNGFTLTLSEFTDVVIVYYASEALSASITAKDYMYATGSKSVIVVPDSDKIQIGDFTGIESQGITLASNSFTVRRTAIYDIYLEGSTSNETASNTLTLAVYDESDNPLGVERRFVPRNDFDQIAVKGLVSLTAGDIVRFYLVAPATGLSLRLTTMNAIIKQL